MRMIIAVDNKSLEEKLIARYYTKYEIYTIKSLDLIERLCENDSIVIVKDNLKGRINIELLVNKIRESGITTRFVVIVRNLSNNLKEKLFANEVFNIIEGTKFPFEKLTDMIDNPQIVVYKNVENVEKSNVIAVTGSFGVGKTTISMLLAKSLARKKKKVVLIDLDVMHPVLDCLVSNAKNYSLLDLVKDIEESKVRDVFNYVSVDVKCKRLHYVLNSSSMSIPKDTTLTYIINYFKDKYDYVVIDTSSLMMSKIYSMSLNIIHIIEPTLKGYKSYKMDIKLIPKEKLDIAMILCNKYASLFLLNRFKRMIRIKVLASIKLSKVCNYFSSVNTWMFKLNFRRIYKKIGIIKLQKIKSIIKRVINEEE